MNKSFVKGAALLGAVFLAVTLVGCGSGSGSSSNNDAPAPTPTFKVTVSGS